MLVVSIKEGSSTFWADFVLVAPTEEGSSTFWADFVLVAPTEEGSSTFWAVFVLVVSIKEGSSTFWADFVLVAPTEEGSSTARATWALYKAVAVLLAGHPQRKLQRRNGVPLRHLVTEFPPHLQGGECQVEIFHRRGPSATGKGQGSQIVPIMGQYEFLEVHACKNTDYSLIL